MLFYGERTRGFHQLLHRVMTLPKKLLMTASLWDIKTKNHNGVINPGTKMSTRWFEGIEEDSTYRRQSPEIRITLL